jgi:hypothetical protein
LSTGFGGEDAKAEGAGTGEDVVLGSGLAAVEDGGGGVFAGDFEVEIAVVLVEDEVLGLILVQNDG